MRNRYAGRCNQCGEWTDAEQGECAKINGRWAITCDACVEGTSEITSHVIIGFSDGNHPRKGDILLIDGVPRVVTRAATRDATADEVEQDQDCGDLTLEQGDPITTYWTAPASDEDFERQERERNFAAEKELRHRARAAAVHQVELAAPPSYSTQTFTHPHERLRREDGTDAPEGWISTSKVGSVRINYDDHLTLFADGSVAFTSRTDFRMPKKYTPWCDQRRVEVQGLAELIQHALDAKARAEEPLTEADCEGAQERLATDDARRAARAIEREAAKKALLEAPHLIAWRNWSDRPASLDRFPVESYPLGDHSPNMYIRDTAHVFADGTVTISRDVSDNDAASGDWIVDHLDAATLARLARYDDEPRSRC